MLFGLASCGFKLCNPCATLPPEQAPVYIQAERFASEMALLLSEKLAAQGVAVTESAELANSVLQLRNENVSRNILSVAPNGDVLEFEAVYLLNWSFSSGEARLVNQRPMVARRAYLYQETQILANEAESRLLVADMREQVANAIIRQLGLLATPAQQAVAEQEADTAASPAAEPNTVEQ